MTILRDPILTIILCGVAFGAGIFGGARGYYLYANHMYLEHPEFLLKMIRRKLIKKAYRCQNMQGEHEQGFCQEAAANACRICHLFYCDKHFDLMMGCCEKDREVERAVRRQAS